MIEILDAAAGDVGHAHAPLAAGLESALEVVDIPGDRMEPVAVARLEARQWRALDTGKVRGNLDGFDDKVADREERGVSKGFGHQRAVETKGREEAGIQQIRSENGIRSGRARGGPDREKSWGGVR